MNLVIATTNQGKLAEFAAFLANTSITVYSLKDYPDMPEIVEDGATFLDNALIKARAVARRSGLPVLADDSGLMVDALDGAPGVMSARFAPTTGERNAKLLALLADTPHETRTARFVCALALVRPDGVEWTTSGVCEGVITHAPAGADGFGYDPLFYYPPLSATFAQLPREVKNVISHRGQALAAFARAVADDGILD